MEMAEPNSDIDSTGISRPLKRRKIRRGTQSCWECKRRKTRCTFATPNESVCDGCRSRRVKCISQHFDDTAVESGGKIGGQSRAETVTGRLVTPNGNGLTNSEIQVGERAKQKAASPSLAESVMCTPQAENRHEGLCRALLEVWPKQEDLELILDAPVSTSILFHGTVCQPYSSLLGKAMPSPREMLQLPSQRSHPVLMARKLLLLGTFMQGIPTGAAKDPIALSTSYKLIMCRLVETSSKLVTSDDELVSSLEGIECIMIEAMYHNNAGNLRRAWVTHRRAMTIAQMSGLHRGAATSATLLDTRNRDRIDPEHMWYRLIISDRYLPLMLGLPQATSENPFGSPQALESCTPLERMERMESTAGGLILQRNGADLHNLARTQKVDKLLREAAALMPPQWWLAPSIAAAVGHDGEELSETIRLMNQFTHYHLLAQLHLPYLLQPSDEPKYEYSRATAVMASREILTRFVYFRGSVSVAAYCRGIDLLAFIASTVLTLAHIDARRQQRVNGGDCGSALHLVTHQRPTDRGLLEQTLQCITKMTESDEDAMACKISNIIEHLLVIEDNAAKDDPYSTTISSEPEMPGSQFGDKLTGAEHSLRIHVPYFGTVRIEHSSISRLVGVEQTGLDKTPGPSSALNSLSHDRENSSKGSLNKDDREEPELREPPPGLSDPAGYRIGGNSANTGWQPVPFHLDLLRTEEQRQLAALEETDFGFEQIGADTATLLVPGLAADVDDWALQGVDMTLFDNLIRGAAEPSAGPA